MRSLCIFLLTFLTGCQTPPANLDKVGTSVGEGRYLGYLKLSEIPYKIPMNIDLIDEPSRENYFTAVVKLSLENQDGPEYVGQYFSNIELHGQKMFFYEKDPLFSLEHVSLRSSSLITGQVSLGGKIVGKFMVSRFNANVAKFFVSTPVLPSLGGKYLGTCKGGEKTIDLKVSSGKQLLEMTKKSYNITGRLSEVNPLVCGNNKDLCTRTRFRGGSYDLFHGQLKLSGLPDSLECRVDGITIQCDGCQMTRLPRRIETTNSEVTKAQRKFVYFSRKTIGGKAKWIDKVDYQGYLFHRHLQMVQPITLDLKNFGRGKIKPQLNLYFGTHYSPDFVVYPMEDMTKTRIGVGDILRGDGEAFVQVNRVGRQGFTGRWFSKTYGYIGEVIFSSTALPGQFARYFKIVPSVAQVFVNEDYRIELKPLSEISDTAKTVYPLHVTGSILEREASRLAGQIENVDYNFYRGELQFLLVGGRVFQGRLKGEQTIGLNWPFHERFGSFLDDQSSSKYYALTHANEESVEAAVDIPNVNPPANAN